MKHLLTATLALFTLALFSCQKEVDDIFAGGGANGTRLIKTVDKTGSDSTVTVYSYNASGKIVRADIFGTDSGQAFDLSLSYVRNSSGIIQKQILKSGDLASAGIDSIVHNVNFDIANNRYKSAVAAFVFFGIPLVDSIAFQYDGSGRLTSEIDYLDIGTGFEPTTKTEYTYAGNNLATEKVYTYDVSTGSYSLEDTYTYEYDAKINPLQFAFDAPILNMYPFYSTNNVAKTTYVSSDPAYNFIATETYTYNSSNRPVTAVETVGSETSTTNYYYQ